MVQILKLIFSLFEKIEKRGIPPIVSSTIILGLIPLLVLMIFFNDEISMFFTLIVCLAYIWLTLCRYFIYVGWQTLLSSFDEFEHLFEDTDELKKQYDKACDDAYSNKILITGIPLIIGMCYIINDYFHDASFGLHIWITIVFGLLFLFGSVGLWNGINLLFYVTNILKNDLRVDPLHPDGLGGLEPIGSFNVKIILILSTGSLVIPFALTVASSSVIGEGSNYISLFFTSLYILIILVSFLIPQMKLNSVAKKYKYEIINGATKKYNELLDEMLENPTSANQAKVDIYHNTYLTEIKKMNVWPFSGKTILEMCGAIALPIITLILQLLDIF